MNQTSVATTFFTPEQSLTLKHKWPLIILYAVIFFVLLLDTRYNFSFLNNGYVRNTLIFFSNTFIWAYFFIINKQWKWALSILVTGALYFIFKRDIADNLDFWIDSSWIKNSSTIRSTSEYGITFLYFIVLCWANIWALQLKNIRQRLLVILVIMASALAVENIAPRILESVTSMSSSIVKELAAFTIFTLLYTLKDMSFWVGHFHLLNKLKAGNHLLETATTLSFNRKAFLNFFLVAFTAILFLFLQLIFSLIASHFNFELEYILKLAEIGLYCFLTIVTGLALGNMLYKKAADEQKYYGVVGFSLLFPLVNLPAYFLIGFDKLKRFLVYDSDRYEQKQKLHTWLSVLLTTVLYLFIMRKYLDEWGTYINLSAFAIMVLLCGLTPLKATTIACIYWALTYIISAFSDYGDFWNNLSDDFSIIGFITKLSASFVIFFIIKNVLSRKEIQWEDTMEDATPTLNNEAIES